MITKHFIYVSFTDENTTHIPKVSGSEISDLTIELFGSYHFLVRANNEDDILEFISRQHTSLDIQEIDESTFKLQTKNTTQTKFKKTIVRNEIRNIKDIEDDLTDQKLLIQSLAIFCTELYTNVLTEEQKEQLINKIPNFKTKIDTLTLLSSNSRVLTMDEMKFSNIVSDELDFNEKVLSTYNNRRD